ncbi:MAG TPA: hypothetical protein VF815_24355 [Myxococcaceae bacterium]
MSNSMRQLLGILFVVALPAVAVAQPAQPTDKEKDTACWQSAYVNCLATNPGTTGSKACYGNYLVCMTSAGTPKTTCHKKAFTDCVGSSDKGSTAVNGCHDNYLKCLTVEDVDTICWKPAYVNCLATNPGVEGSKACYNNYLSCTARASVTDKTCFQQSFVACVASSDGSSAAVTGCHTNYLKCAQ